MDYDIRERDTRAEPGSQSLEDSFLRGEPASESLYAVGTMTHLVQLFLDKAARDQRIAWILDPAPDLGYVDEIDSMSNDLQLRRRSLPCCPLHLAMR